MADTLTELERSRRMSLVKGRDTQPELLVRRLTHSMGYRYRLHEKTLPGRPDLVFRTRKKVIFVHGCFWHRHSSNACRLARLPRSRLDFWQPKLEANRLRDEAVQIELAARHWSALVIWECELSDEASVRDRIAAFLGS